MSVHREGDKWVARYREGKRNRSKSFELKGEATDFDNEQKSRRRRGERVIRPKDTPTLDDLAKRFMGKRGGEGIATSTLLFNASVLEKHISPFLGYLRVAEISPERLDEWQGECQASPYMMNRAMELLGQLLAYAKQLRFVDVNHASDLKRRPHKARKGRTASPTEIEAMRTHFLLKDRLGYATLASTLGYVGLRPSEALLVRWDQLQGRRFLLEGEQTKTGAVRYPEVPAPVLADLAQWRMAQKNPEGLIFPRPDGEPWRKTDWDNWRARWFKPAAEAAGLGADFRPYDLRHTCASLMLRAQAPPAEVAGHMGHGLQVLFSTYGHEIEQMRGQNAQPIEQAILAARGSGVRKTFGRRAS